MIYKVFYTDRFVKKNMAGKALWFFIFIRPAYRDDVGLLEHEKQHVRQFWRDGLFLHSIRYELSKKYRLACEVEGYKVQLDAYGDGEAKREWRLNIFADYISSWYNLDITRERAMELLYS